MSDVIPTVPEALPPTTHTWIDRLSDELLSMIFIYTHDRLAFEEEMYQDTYIMLRRPLCAFISHVSLRWRNVAIACQYLWALLPYSSEEWTEACMVRAHSAPLTLRLKPEEYYESYSPEIFRPLYSLIPRAKSLHALHRLEEEEYQKEMLDALAVHAAPLLEELEMDLERPTIDMDGPYPVDYLFKQETPPNLRHISLYNCSIQFPHSIFSPALTDIYLLDARIWMNMDRMVEFFEAVPLLESFKYHCINDVTANDCNVKPSQTYPLRCVSLPKLRKFDVQAPLVVGILIFSYLVLSPTAELRFLVCDNGSLQSHISNAELLDLIELGAAALQEHYAGYSEQEHYDCAIEVDHTTISHRPELSVSILDRAYPDATRARALAIALYLPIPTFASMRTLKITPDGVTGARKSITFRDLASYCNKVERLSLSGPAPVWLEAELCEDKALGSVLFPTCNDVTINGFNFAGQPGTMDHELGYNIPDGFDSRVAEVLRAWNASRGSACALRLTLDDCRIGPRTRSIFEETLGPDRVHIVKGRIIGD